MVSKKTISPLFAPIFGTLPIVIFLVLDFLFSYPIAFLGGLVCFGLLMAISVFILKRKYSYTLITTGYIFLLFLVFAVIKPFNALYDDHSFTVFELLQLFCFYGFILIKNFFQQKIILLKTKDRKVQIERFNADVYVIKAATHAVFIHLQIVFIYTLFPAEYHTAGLDRFIYNYLFFLFIALHYTFEIYHYTLISKKMRKEKFLPVVDELGTVHGKIAYSLSKDNKYMHPVIRIILVYKGRLFLKEQQSDELNTQCIDYPFERYMRYGETLEEAALETLKEGGADKSLPHHYIFHHVHRDESTNRLIYLYICNIQDENLLQKLNLSNGKWWMSKQIIDNLHTGLFSNSFEKEFEFVNKTVLMAEKIVHGLK
jgi:hypothetical protein